MVSVTASSNPAEEDRVEPVGTNYTPISLGSPKKLINPFEKKAQEGEQQALAPVKNAGGRISWSERQTLAKKKAKEEEIQSKAAMASIPVASWDFKWKAPVAAGSGSGAAAGAASSRKGEEKGRQDEMQQQHDEDDKESVRYMHGLPVYYC